MCPIMTARPLSLAGLALSVIVAACGSEPRTPTAGGAAANCMSRAYDTIGGPLALTDHTGQAVTEADFKGRASLVFFGFTYCPDVCPMTLVRLDEALSKLPDGAERPRVILVTVDPQRDTPEALASYLSVDAFPNDTVGLTGSDEAIRTVATAFKADYYRVEQPDSTAGYTMDHTSLVHLMDADWRHLSFFSEMDSPETIAACLEQLL